MDRTAVLRALRSVCPRLRGSDSPLPGLSQLSRAMLKISFNWARFPIAPGELESRSGKEDCWQMDARRLRREFQQSLSPNGRALQLENDPEHFVKGDFRKAEFDLRRLFKPEALHSYQGLSL